MLYGCLGVWRIVRDMIPPPAHVWSEHRWHLGVHLSRIVGRAQRTLSGSFPEVKLLAPGYMGTSSVNCGAASPWPGEEALKTNTDAM